MRSNIFETAIGALVLLITFTFVIYAYQVAGPKNISGYDVTAQFDRVDGLAIGADVRVSGIKVGSVTNMELDADSFGANITITLDDAVTLPQDTSARITSSGILGQQYISLEPGGAEDSLKDAGEIQFTSGSVDLMGLISRFIFSSGDSQ